MPVRQAIYSGVPVWEVLVGQIEVVRKQADNAINLSHFLSVLGVHRQKRAEFLERYRSLRLTDCYVVHGGIGRLKGTWAPFEKVQNLVEEMDDDPSAWQFNELVANDISADPPQPWAIVGNASSSNLNPGVPVAAAPARRPRGRPPGSGQGPKKPAYRPRRSNSMSSLTSVSDDDGSDSDSSGSHLTPRKRKSRRSHQPLPARAGTRTSTRRAATLKGKERESMDVDDEYVAGPQTGSTSGFGPAALPTLLPGVSIFHQLFGSSKPQNEAAMTFLRDLKVPKLVSDDSDMEDENTEETTPKYVATLDGIRIQSASSAGSSTTQQPPQLPAAPQSPSFFADKSKTSTEQAGSLPMNMNIGQIFDFKLKQREAKLAAAGAAALLPAPAPPPPSYSIKHTLAARVQADSASAPNPALLSSPPPPLTDIARPTPYRNLRKVVRQPEPSITPPSSPLSSAGSSPAVGLVLDNPIASGIDPEMAYPTTVLPLAQFDFDKPLPSLPPAPASSIKFTSPVQPFVPMSGFAMSLSRCSPEHPR